MAGKGHGAVAEGRQLRPQENLQQTAPAGDRYRVALRAVTPLAAAWGAVGPSRLLWAGAWRHIRRGEQPTLVNINSFGAVTPK